MLKIEVQTEPRPQGRVRVVNNHAYYRAVDSEFRDEISWAARSVMKDAEPLKCPLSVSVKIYRRFKPASKRYGDVDNFLKSIFDGLNGIVYEDDAQIVRIVAEKFRDKKNPRAEIVISEYE